MQRKIEKFRDNVIFIIKQNIMRKYVQLKQINIANLNIINFNKLYIF